MGSINWNRSYTPVYYENGKEKHGFFPNREEAVKKFFAIDANNDGQSDYRANDWRDFFTALGVIESDFKYGANNQKGYYGKYQIGKMVLADVKFFNKDGKMLCARSMEDFRRNAVAQELAALREFCGIGTNTGSRYTMTRNGLKQIDSTLELNDLLGKTYTAKFLNSKTGETHEQQVTFTQAGISAAAHLLGPGGKDKDGNKVGLAALLEKIKKGETIDDSKEGGDGNNVAFTTYMQLCADYDISALINATTKADFDKLANELLGLNKDAIRKSGFQEGRCRASKYTDQITQAQRTPVPRMSGCDPLAVDLDKDGVETTAVKNGTYFDHDANGFSEDTGWINSDDGLLVMDRNNDGIINNGTELFGDQTILSNGNKATDGFQALAELDSNTDGKIDSTDTAYSQLRVWQDYDEDGYSTEEELLTLDQAGIQSINLQSETTNITDTEGNTKTKQGTFEFTDGTTGEISNYNLKTDMAYTIAKELIEVPEDIASLPDIQGYGTMYDLHQAMARERLAGSETLKGLVEQFTAATDVTARNILMEQILFRWVGAEGIDPNSRGRVVDARKMAVMDNVFGSTYRGTTGPNPHQWAAPFLFQTFGNQPIS